MNNLNSSKPDSSKKIKVMIAGDYLIFRNGLKMLIESRKNFKVTDAVPDLSDVKVHAGIKQPDVLLIDAQDGSNVEFDALLTSFSETIPTIVMTNSYCAKTHQKYLLLGANGVVTKDQDEKSLFRAIERVSTDDLWFKREVMVKTVNHLIEEKRKAPERIYSEKYNTLTKREREVLASVCQGMKNKDIAEFLFITETTVRHHLTSLFEKLNVKNRLALVALAFSEGLVKVPPIDTSAGH